MSREFSVHERVPFPVQTVWSYISDMELSHTWIKGINGMTPVVPGMEDCVGARYQTNITTRGRQSVRELEILSWEPNHRFSIATNDMGISAVYEYLLRRRNEKSTDITLYAKCTARGLWKLALPFTVMVMKKHDQDQLILLREAMESKNQSMERYFEAVN